MLRFIYDNPFMLLAFLFSLWGMGSFLLSRLRAFRENRPYSYLEERRKYLADLRRQEDEEIYFS